MMPKAKTSLLASVFEEVEDNVRQGDAPVVAAGKALDRIKSQNLWGELCLELVTAGNVASLWRIAYASKRRSITSEEATGLMEPTSHLSPQDISPDEAMITMTPRLSVPHPDNIIEEGEGAILTLEPTDAVPSPPRIQINTLNHYKGKLAAMYHVPGRGYIQLGDCTGLDLDKAIGRYRQSAKDHEARASQLQAVRSRTPDDRCVIEVMNAEDLDEIFESMEEGE